jgi:hypothetical protein
MPDLTIVSHIGIVVPDVEAACRDLSATLGVTWAPVIQQTVRARSNAEDIEAIVTLTWSREGPPYLELVHGDEGTPWASGGHRRLDHLGYWTDDVAAATASLEPAGLAVEVAGLSPESVCPFDFAYLVGGGLRFEVLDAKREQALARWFATS